MLSHSWLWDIEIKTTHISLAEKSMSVCNEVSYLCSTNHIFLLVLASACWALRNYGRQEGKLEEEKKKSPIAKGERGKKKKNLFWNALCLRLMHGQNLINLKQQSLPWAVSVNTPSSSNRRDNEKSEGVAHPIALLVGSQPVMLSLLHVCIPHQKLIPTSVFTWKYLSWVAIILCPVQQGGFVNISHDKSHSPNFPLDIFEEDRIPPNGLPYQLWTGLLIATEDGRQSCIFTAEAHLSEDAQDQAICSFS